MKIDKKIKKHIDRVLEPVKMQGVKINMAGEDGVELELQQTMDTANYMGALHGGVAYTLADICAGISLLVHGHKVTTIEGSMNYLREGVRGPFIAKSKILHKGRTTGVVNIEIRDGNGELIASGMFTMFILGSI